MALRTLDPWLSELSDQQREPAHRGRVHTGTLNLRVTGETFSLFKFLANFSMISDRTDSWTLSRRPFPCSLNILKVEENVAFALRYLLMMFVKGLRFESSRSPSLIFIHIYPLNYSYSCNLIRFIDLSSVILRVHKKM